MRITSALRGFTGSEGVWSRKRARLTLRGLCEGSDRKPFQARSKGPPVVVGLVRLGDSQLVVVHGDRASCALLSADPLHTIPDTQTYTVGSHKFRSHNFKVRGSNHRFVAYFDLKYPQDYLRSKDQGPEGPGPFSRLNF